MARSAHREAVTHFEQALSALPHLPECRETSEQAIDLRINLRHALFALGHHTQLLDHLRKAEALAEAHTLVEQQEERWWEAEVCRLRGVLLLRQTMPPPEEAEIWLRRALDVARRQEAKSLELRAAMSLSRLWQRQGKHNEARQLLSPVYSWFTEGFETADLQEAKALLAELS
jgi:tetratricopeptide (TPR) repeat protein